MPRFIMLATALAIGLAACSNPSSPEEQVRAVIAAAEKGAEARDVSAVMDLVSDDYNDPRGQNKQDISDLLRGYFLINQTVHLLVRVEKIEFPADELANARVVVGMLGRQAQEDWSFAAEVHTFQVRLMREDGDWHLVRADWDRR